VATRRKPTGTEARVAGIGDGRLTLMPSGPDRPLEWDPIAVAGATGRPNLSQSPPAGGRRPVAAARPSSPSRSQKHVAVRWRNSEEPSTSHPRRANIVQEEGFDTYVADKKYPQPTSCPGCGAVFDSGRWEWSEHAPSNGHESSARHAGALATATRPASSRSPACSSQSTTTTCCRPSRTRLRRKRRGIP
jgi:hypothetical protein